MCKIWDSCRWMRVLERLQALIVVQDLGLLPMDEGSKEITSPDGRVRLGTLAGG